MKFKFKRPVYITAILLLSLVLFFVSFGYFFLKVIGVGEQSFNLLGDVVLTVLFLGLTVVLALVFFKSYYVFGKKFSLRFLISVADVEYGEIVGLAEVDGEIYLQTAKRKIKLYIFEEDKADFLACLREKNHAVVYKVEEK